MELQQFLVDHFDLEKSKKKKHLIYASSTTNVPEINNPFHCP